MDKETLESIGRKIESELNIKTFIDDGGTDGALPKWAAVKRCSICTMQIRDDDVSFAKDGTFICHNCYEHIGVGILTPTGGLRLHFVIFGRRVWTPFVVDPNRKRRVSRERRNGKTAV